MVLDVSTKRVLLGLLAFGVLLFGLPILLAPGFRHPGFERIPSNLTRRDADWWQGSSDGITFAARSFSGYAQFNALFVEVDLTQTPGATIEGATLRTPTGVYESDTIYSPRFDPADPWVLSWHFGDGKGVAEVVGQQCRIELKVRHKGIPHLVGIDYIRNPTANGGQGW